MYCSDSEMSGDWKAPGDGSGTATWNSSIPLRPTRAPSRSTSR